MIKERARNNQRQRVFLAQKIKLQGLIKTSSIIKLTPVADRVGRQYLNLKRARKNTERLEFIRVGLETISISESESRVRLGRKLINGLTTFGMESKTNNSSSFLKYKKAERIGKIFSLLHYL